MLPAIAKQLKALPDSPGIYIYRGSDGKILYIGKATSLKRRVSSYFQKAHEQRIEKLVSEIASIETKDTSSALEALLLEAEYIKKYFPPYNIMEKDDKTFAYIAITDELVPRVIVTRPTQREKVKAKYLYGPYTSAATARTALKLIRKIFPFHTLSSNTKRRHPDQTTCFDATIGLCSGICGGKQTMTDYRKTLGSLRLFLQGKRARTIASLKRSMITASKAQRYERAAQLRNQLHSLEHIRDIALLTRDEFDPTPKRINSYHIPHRIEAYDISHIFGEDAVGSMVVFTNGTIDSSQYRKFRIRGLHTPDDTSRIREVLERRLKHTEWEYPELMLIDGGTAQLHTAQMVIKASGLTIPVAALAKGPDRKGNDLYSSDPMAKLIPMQILIRLRDESHRFAITYHRQLKRRRLIPSL